MCDLSVDTFYFIRHGETTDNHCGFVSGGERDVDLTQEGRAKASSLAEQFSALTEVSCIYCSPMKRALETAALLNSIAQKPLIVHPALYEWMVGDYAGRLDAEVSGSLSNWSCDPPNGETREELAARVYRALSACIQGAGQAKCLIVAHAGVWWGLAQCLGMNREPIANCELFKIQRSSGVWRAMNVAR